MKSIKKFSLAAFLALIGLGTLASCGEKVPSAAETVLSKILLVQEGEDVEADFTVPKTVKYNSELHEITWSSNNEAVLSFADNSDSTKYTADIHRPFDANTDVVLTASATVDGKTATVDFKTTVKKLDAEAALAAAITTIGVEPSYEEKTVVNLPAKSNEYKEEITFAYELAKAYKTTTLENNVLTLDPALGSETVELKVTATSGSNNLEKTVKTSVSKEMTYLTVADALEQADGTIIYVQAKVKTIKNATYGNMVLEGADGKTIETYGLYKANLDKVTWDEAGKFVSEKADAPVKFGDWKEEEKVKEGDYIYIVGYRSTYKTTAQVSNPVLLDYPFLDTAAALDIADGTIISMYATIKTIKSATYGNMVLEGADGKTIETYGLYTADLSKVTWDEAGKFVSEKADAPVKFGDWKEEDKVKVGDVIAIIGYRSTYKTTAQVSNAVLLQVLKSAPAESGDVKAEVPANAVVMNVKADPVVWVNQGTETNLTAKLTTSTAVTVTAIKNGWEGNPEYAATSGYAYISKSDLRLYKAADGNGAALKITAATGKIANLYLTVTEGELTVLVNGQAVTLSEGTTNLFVINAAELVIQNKGNATAKISELAVTLG